MDGFTDLTGEGRPARSWDCVHTWSEAEPLGGLSWVRGQNVERSDGIYSVWVGLRGKEGRRGFPSLCRGTIVWPNNYRSASFRTRQPSLRYHYKSLQLTVLLGSRA